VLGGREQRQIARKRAATKTITIGEDDEAVRSRRRKRASHKMDASSATHHEVVTVEFPCTVRSFSAAVGIQASALQRQLMAMDQLVTINSQLDAETIELLAMELASKST